MFEGGPWPSEGKGKGKGKGTDSLVNEESSSL